MVFGCGRRRRRPLVMVVLQQRHSEDSDTIGPWDASLTEDLDVHRGGNVEAGDLVRAFEDHRKGKGSPRPGERHQHRRQLRRTTI